MGPVVSSLSPPSTQDLAVALLPPVLSKEGSFQSKASFRDKFKGNIYENSRDSGAISIEILGLICLSI